MSTLLDFIKEQPKHPIKVITFNTRGDKAIKKTVNAVQVTGTNNGYMSLIDETGSYIDSACIWVVVDELGVSISELYNLHNPATECIEKIAEIVLSNWSTKELVIKSFDDMAKNEKFFKLTDLEFISHIEPNRVNVYMESRNKFIAKKEAERKWMSDKRKEQVEIKRNKLLSEYNNKLATAEHSILAKQNFYNDEIYDINGTEKLILLELFKKHNITIPLRTAGWIAKALCEIKFVNDKISYTYYSSSRNSKVFGKYLQQLEDIILANNSNENYQ